MKLALLVIALCSIGGSAAAAARTCRDVLISTPAKRYSCNGAYAYTETGPPLLQGTAGFRAEFVDLSPPDPAVFLMRAANGIETPCICNSKGTTAKPAFLSSMSFTCQSSSGIIRGEVTGRNGDRIRNFAIHRIRPQSEGGSELNIGGCVRIP